ncbi:MAG: transposase, partial [Aquificaceae bacterium]
TGIKLTNTGEWPSKKYVNKKRKGWIKLHVTLNIDSGKMMAMKVTDNRTHDSQCATGLIERARKKAEAVGCKVKKVIADTGYNTHQIFRYSGKRGIKPVIKVRRAAGITGNRARDEVVREMRRGRRWWKEGNG